MTNILDRIKKELEANAKIINAEIPNGLSIEDRVNSIENQIDFLTKQHKTIIVVTTWQISTWFSFF